MRELVKLVENKKLSKSQKLIWDYIISDYDKAAYMTAAELADTVGVSESTAVRFAVFLGFGGYSEMCAFLRDLGGRKLTSVQRLELSDRRISGDNILSEVLNEDMARIGKTLEMINEKEFMSAAESICRGRNIYIIGARSSAALASFFGYYLNHICENVRLLSAISGVEILEQLVRADSSDVVVAMSFPRYSDRIIRAAEYAKSRGAAVVSLTDGPESPLCPLSDHVIYAKSDMVSFADSLTAPLSVLNALIVAIGKIKRESAAKMYGELESLWESQGVYGK